MLLNSVQNHFFEGIRHAGFDPIDFEWISTTWRGVPVSLRLRGTEYFFALDPSYQCCQYSPGLETKTEVHLPGNLVNTLSFFDLWLSYTKREIETPDLWAAVRQERDFLAATGEDNSGFTPEEQTRVRASVTEIRLHLTTTYQLSAEQLRLITSRLDSLADAARRVGRIDWKNQAVGALINIAITLSLNQDATRGLFRFAANVLHWLMTGQSLLSP